ncbi:MAG: sensor histidine kinase [Opitutae bacterium]|nr:sensor histidine kinase [Opitutae bacterium]
MNRPRIVSWLPIAGMLAVVAGGLGWLLLGFAGNRGGVEPWAGAADVARSVPTNSAQAGSTLEYFVERPGATMTLADVERLPADAWRRWPGASHYTGGFGTVLWARVTLRNAESQARSGVLADADFFADRVDAWVLAEAADTTAAAEERVGVNALHLVSGEGVAPAAKAVPGRAVAFSVSVPAHGEQVVYLRAEDFFRPFFQLEWWPDAAAYHAAKTRGLIAEAVYFGGLLALLGYNVLLWVRLRLADIGYYAAYLSMAGTFMVLGRVWGPELGWALGSPGLETALTLAMAVSGFFLARFAREFLELKQRGGWGDRIAGWLAAMMLALALAALSTPWLKQAIWLPITVAGIGVTHGGLVVLAAIAWRAGARQARFFVLSFGCLSAGSLPLVAVQLWKLDVKNAAMMGLMIGSALEMLLLSLAVADRFATAQREKAAAQARLIEEAEQRQVIEAAYADELEIEVAERTRDLEAANTDKDRMLIALGHDLRSPLAALTQRAELLRGGSGSRPPMATTAEKVLGEFSGDVAGAGRQMLLLIEDIVLWARLRAGAQPASSAHPVSGLVTPVVRLHRPLAERRGVALTVDVPESLAAWTDLVLAQTMVRNLVGNAVKFARSRVEVIARTEADAVRITVRDDGPGLPSAVLARLRGEASAAGDNGEGGGMGLRLSQEIGMTLGARIEAGSGGAGGGAELSVILPATDRGAGEAIS